TLVDVLPIRPTDLFLQVGAYSEYDNAARMRDALVYLGPVRISPGFSGGKQVFRVRIGPLLTVADADRILESLISAGKTGAKMVID
ncbi:MAG: SPOR domain-containing protein, partial [Pseudomonadota bacterium]|nr:SPOR domain-containing protein [Pseudomonadota bacterium]